MLMTKDNAMRIVHGCHLAAVACSNEYAGKTLCSVNEYIGSKGAGYTVVQDNVCEYWVFDKNEINTKIYNGEYVIDLDGIKNTTKWHGVDVDAIHKLTLDTITGIVEISNTEQYKAIQLAGHTLQVCWMGNVSEAEIRRKIRRKMKEMIDSGKCILIDEDGE